MDLKWKDCPTMGVSSEFTGCFCHTEHNVAHPFPYTPIHTNRIASPSGSRQSFCPASYNAHHFWTDRNLWSSSQKRQKSSLSMPRQSFGSNQHVSILMVLRLTLWLSGRIVWFWACILCLFSLRDSLFLNLVRKDLPDSFFWSSMFTQYHPSRTGKEAIRTSKSL